MGSSWVARGLVLVAIVYTTALTLGSLVRPVQVDIEVNHLDKYVHFAAYFGLVLLWLCVARVFFKNQKITQKPMRLYLLVAIAAVIYGIIIELLQGNITDYRSQDIWDAVANITGVITGSCVFLAFFKNLQILK